MNTCVKSDVEKYCNTIKGKPLLGKPFANPHGFNIQEIERLKNELLQERKLHETTDCTESK